MIRRSAVAGMFYPAERRALRTMVEGFLKGSGRSSNPNVTGIVSPHAGYVYSGAVAGAAFATAPDDVERVVIMAPPHRYPVTGASAFRGEAFETPLGNVPIDTEFTAALLDAGLVFQPGAHMQEHSAEVQVPFVQVRWPDASIVVILQGTVSRSFSSDLASVLAGLASDDRRTLIVASSDLSHYHAQSVARDKDRLIIQAFLSGDVERLAQALAEGGEACGIGPVMTLMSYAAEKGYGEFGMIDWRTSADASGDESSVVGYFAGFCGRGRKDASESR